MKTTLALLIILISTTFAIGQGCPYPIDQSTFQNGFNKIAILQTNKLKADEAMAFVNGKCFSAAQIKTLAQLITEDSYRLEFCKSAFNYTNDIANFYDVYDAFQNRSAAFRLHDYVQSRLTTRVEVAPTTPAQPATTTAVAISFPKLVYPNSATYTGMKGCEGPVISNTEFIRIAESVVAQPTDESKELAITTASESYCLDFSQLMKLTSLVQPERSRLRILTTTLRSVYDQGSYRAGAALFTTKQTQSEWLTYGNNFLTPVATPVCEETEAQFNQSIKAIQSKTFDRDRIELIGVLSKDHCFNVSQIKKIVGQLYPGSGKLESLKRLYDKCPDKKNYYTLVDELTFGSEKEELMNFIKSRN